ncbi:hypothetical protein MferCBS31731_006940 [Microsporum ferrugineum]
MRGPGLWVANDKGGFKTARELVPLLVKLVSEEDLGIFVNTVDEIDLGLGVVWVVEDTLGKLVQWGDASTTSDESYVFVLIWRLTMIRHFKQYGLTAKAQATDGVWRGKLKPQTLSGRRNLLGAMQSQTEEARPGPPECRPGCWLLASIEEHAGRGLEVPGDD